MTNLINWSWLRAVFSPTNCKLVPILVSIYFNVNAILKVILLRIGITCDNSLGLRARIYININLEARSNDDN